MTKKLTITKKKSISECKKLWKAIDKSGLGKYGFLYSTETGCEWSAKGYSASCPLCEYARNGGGSCRTCPLVTKYGKRCYEMGFYTLTGSYTKKWMEAVRGL